MTKYEQEKRAEKELGAIFIPESLAVYSPTLADRVRAYRTRLLEQGNTRLSIFLTPDASAVLTTLRTQYPNKSINDIISSVLTGGIPIAPPQEPTP